MHDQAIYGVKPEGKLSVTYDKQTFSFPDGETYELCKPNYTITEWYKDSIAPEDLFCTVRIPLRHVGMGQMMAIDRREIEALAAKSNYPEYGISGRCNYITEKGVTGVGLSLIHIYNTNSSILMYQEHLSLQYTFSALVFEPRLYIPLSILCTHIPFSQRYKHTLKTLPSKYSSYLFILFNFSSKELFLRATCIFHLAYT